MNDKGQQALKVLLVLGIKHDFKVGDEVFDRTAIENGWPDFHGKVVEVDSSNVKVSYDSGNSRWKMHINLRHVVEPS